MLKEVERTKLSDQVFNQLRDSILSEGYISGERLPPERELCQLLDVNRSSVREALKRLEQARLIETRQGQGSIVLDFRLNAGFDLLGDMIQPAGEINEVSLRSIFEFRSLIGPEIARLAAMRIEKPELEALEKVVAKIEDCSGEDVAEFQRLDFEFHSVMAQASENLALLLIQNSVREIYFAYGDYFASIFEEAMKDRGIYRQIYEALFDHNEKLGESICRELIEEGNRLFWKHYLQIKQTGEQSNKT